MKRKNGSDTMALVGPISSVEDIGADEIIYKTPFQQFVASLEKRYAGNTNWVHFPVRQALSWGLWLLVTNLAKQLEISLSTKSKVEDVSKRLDRLVNVGLTITYSNMSEAVEDFHRHVVLVIERAIELGYKPSIQMPIKAWKLLSEGNTTFIEQEIRKAGQVRPVGSSYRLWQYPVALFFAPLVKTARLRGEEIAGLLRQLESRNWIGVHDYTYLDLGNATTAGTYGLVVEYLDPTKEPAVGRQRTSFSRESIDLLELCRLARVLPKKLNYMLLEQSAFRKLGIKPQSEWDIEYDDAIFSISDTWLRTQVLLTAVSAKDKRDVLLLREYMPAVRLIHNADQEKLIEQAMVRVGADKLGLVERSIIFKIISNIIDLIKEYDLEEINPIEQSTSIICNTSEMMDDERLSHDTAVAVAQGESSLHLEVVNYPTLVANSLVWSQINIEQLRKMLDYEFLSYATLVRGVAEGMPRSKQEQASQTLLEYVGKQGSTRENIEILFEYGLVQLNKDILDEYIEIIPLRHLCPWLVSVRDELYCSGWENIRPDLAVLLMRGVIRLPKDEIYDFVHRRFAWVHVLNVLLLENEDGVDLVVKLTKQVDPEIRKLWILGALVLQRLEAYTVGVEEDEGRGETEPWNKSKVVSYGHLKDLLDIPEAKLARFLGKHSEDDMLRWLYAEESDAEVRIQTYLNLRSAYYKK
ncbi:MAG: hypothetical protein ABIJ23_00645 [Candidatus Magasanikbacteria bacterium]